MQEEIVMTPSKKDDTTIINIEKVIKTQLDESQVAHKAGGQHSGLIINKQTNISCEDNVLPHLQLEFKCFLVDQRSGKHVPENRLLKFWFSTEIEYLERVSSAYDFFRELVKPEQFPRDYVGFIKKTMKQMQLPQYNSIKRIEVSLKQLKEEPIPRKKSKIYVNLMDGSGIVKEDSRPREIIVQEELLHYLESAYPNILPTNHLVEMLKTDHVTVENQLKVLIQRDLIREIEPGRWVRKVLNTNTEIKVVKQMPSASHGVRPTIAIITSKYYEKIAVDSMMENTTTFVKFKTEGESNVYTIGFIGGHQIVSTKLPAIGGQMAAQISAGSTTTRLLGTFSDLDHVLLVGVCGGVPHYTDYYKDIRLGDIIISSANPTTPYSYIYCDKVNLNNENSNDLEFTSKGWAPVDVTLTSLAHKVCEQGDWSTYITESQKALEDQEVDFVRPLAESDKLYMLLGGSDVIEVAHPVPPPNCEVNKGVHFAPLASGKPLMNNEETRNEFASRHDCRGVDGGFDQVLESIVGNRKDSFIFIRAVSDYSDGSKASEWQPFAALMAAAFMKSLILALPLPQNDD